MIPRFLWAGRMVLGLCLCAVPPGLPAQQELPVHWITVDDGLPQGMVRCMLQDRHGFIWFGTKDGLVRSDGHRLRVFRHDATAGSGLSGDHITALLESRDGLLWVATEEHGICAFDPATERFTKVAMDERVDRAAARSPQIMVEHTDGHIWVYHLFGALHVIERGRAGGKDPGLPARLVPLNVAYGDVPMPFPSTGLLGLRNGRLVVTDADSLRVLGTDNGGIIVHGTHALRGADTGTGKPDERRMLFHDAEGRRLLVLRGNDIHFHDDRSGAYRSTLTLPKDLDVQGYFLLDGRGRLWMGASRSGSASRVDLATGRSEDLAFVAQNHSGDLSRPLVLCWLEDDVGNIWAGTAGFGVVRHAARAERFQRLRQGRYSTFIQPDLAGRFIVVGEGHYWLNAPDGQVRVLEVHQVLEAQGRQAVWGGVVVDPSGVQWATGERPGGLDPVLYRFDPARSEGLVPVLLSAGERPCEVLPGHGHDLWVTVFGGPMDQIDRLLRVDTRTGRVLQRHPLPRPIRVAEYRAISDWRPQPDGTLLMGTLEGVMSLHPGQGRWRTWTHRPEDPRSLPDATIFSICPDPATPDRILWVGTAGAGLAKLDLTTGRCERFTSAHGLSNDVIYGILPDPRGNLWLSTNNGLCRFDPLTGATRHYTRDDGLCGNEFNRYSAHRGVDGRFYFGGVDGVTVFDPEALYEVERPSPTRITGLRLADRELLGVRSSLVDGPGTTTDSSVTHAHGLTLPFDERVLTFTFACMDHTAPARNAFRYRLIGFREDWLYTNGVHEATFTNLDPGSYRFEVQGRNSAGIWDPVGAALTLVVTPPWWGTWWFRALLVLAVACLLYALYRYRLAQQLKLALVRDRIARDLHDEIGSTLSSVALFSEVAKRQGAAGADVKLAMLDRISQSTGQMMESMNDIVWAVNSRNDDLLHVVQRMNEFAGRMAEAGGFTLHMDQQGFDPDRVLTMTQRKNLYLIFKEAVNNAAKYARCRTLTVRITTAPRHLHLRVSDDGAGLSASTNGNGAVPGGNGLRNMQVRAAEIHGALHVTSAPGAGTTIDLRFPL